MRVVSVKTARTGFTESRRILDLCLARNVPVVVGSQYEGAIGARGDDRVRRRVRRDRRPARPRSRTSSTSPTTSSSPRPEIRDGRATAPARAGPRPRGRRGAPAALPGGPLMLFMAEMEVRLPPDMPAEQADELKAREREYSAGAAARRALAAPVAGGRPLRERERARRRARSTSCTSCSPACRCSPTWTSASRRWRAIPTPSTEEENPMSDRANQLISDILRRDPRGDRRARRHLRGVPGRQAVVHRRRRGRRVAAVRRRLHRARRRGAGVRQPRRLPGHDPRPVPPARRARCSTRRSSSPTAPDEPGDRDARLGPRDRRRRQAAGRRQPRRLAGGRRGPLLGLHARSAGGQPARPGPHRRRRPLRVRHRRSRGRTRSRSTARPAR